VGSGVAAAAGGVVVRASTTAEDLIVFCLAAVMG
jgi:hypothetical protein